MVETCWNHEFVGFYPLLVTIIHHEISPEFVPIPKSGCDMLGSSANEFWWVTGTSPDHPVAMWKPEARSPCVLSNHMQIQLRSLSARNTSSTRKPGSSNDLPKLRGPAWIICPWSVTAFQVLKMILLFCSTSPSSSSCCCCRQSPVAN